MTKNLKKVISTIASFFVLINSAAVVYAEKEADGSVIFSVPDECTFEAPIKDAENEGAEFYEWMREAIKEKEEKYNRFIASRTSFPPSVNLNVEWERQINGYYCGPATATMILKNIGYIHATQTILAGKDYLRTTTDGTPWYSGTTQTSIYYFNMPYGLGHYQNINHSIYVNSWPYDVCNNNNQSDYINKMMYTLSEGYAVPLFGKALSGSGISSYLKNYTVSSHWVVLEGYSGNGDKFIVVDPAAGIKGFENQPKRYTASKSDVLKFAYMGVVW